MRICILCEDKNIEAARTNCRNVFPKTKESDFEIPALNISSKALSHLSVPLSKDGKQPVTHWFCCMSCDEETFQRIKDISLYSTIEESSPKEFLQKWQLKLIKS